MSHRIVEITTLPSVTLNNIQSYNFGRKKKKVFTIAVHVGGTAKRGAPGSDNERMIDAVAPFADYLIVTKDSNKDGRFTKIAEDKGIPLTEIEYALNLVDIFKQVFK